MSNPLHPCAILLQPRLYERGTARPASEARRYLTCTNLVCSGWDRHASPRASSIPVFQLMCGNKPCDMWSCGGSAAAGEAGSLSAGGPERYRPFFHRMCSCDAAYQNFRDNQMHDGHALQAVAHADPSVEREQQAMRPAQVLDPRQVSHGFSVHHRTNQEYMEYQSFSQASALPPAGQLSGPGGPGLTHCFWSSLLPSVAGTSRRLSVRYNIRCQCPRFW